MTYNKNKGIFFPKTIEISQHQQKTADAGLCYFIYISVQNKV